MPKNITFCCFLKSIRAGVADTGSGIQDLGFRDLGSGILVPGSGIWDPGSGIRDLGSRIWDPGSGAFLTLGPGTGMGKKSVSESLEKFLG